MGEEYKPRLNIAALQEMYSPVSDAQVSAEWYIRHFGLRRVSSGEGRVTLALEEGALLTLLKSERLNRYESPPIHFKAQDARKAHAALDLKQVRAGEPDDWHHYVDFDVRDPDGNPFNVISEPAWRQTPNNYFRIDGIFLGAADFNATFAWYQDILGAEVAYDFTVVTESSPEARMRCFRGVPVTLFDSPRSFLQGRVCDYRTTDAAADYAYLRGRGVRVTELAPRPEDGALSFAFFDPEGREIGLVETVSSL
jgi:catechol 2,3-dioxygenase-like lactoylglutathione lyase family enzyme